MNINYIPDIFQVSSFFIFSSAGRVSVFLIINPRNSLKFVLLLRGQMSLFLSRQKTFWVVH